MAIIAKLSGNQAIAIAENAGRFDNFGYEGWAAIYRYLQEYSEQTGEDLEFDPIGCCCEFTRFDDIADYNDFTDSDFESFEDADFRDRCEIFVAFVDGGVITRCE